MRERLVCYDWILSSVNYIFDWCYSPGRNLGGEFFSSETPNEKEKKIFSAYGAMTDVLFSKTLTPVEMKATNRARAEESQNKSVSTENHDQVVPTSPNEESEFTKVGDEYTGFYEVDISGNEVGYPID